MGQMLYKLAANDVQPHCMLEEVVLVINDKQSGPWRGCSSKADAIPLVWGLVLAADVSSCAWRDDWLGTYST